MTLRSYLLAATLVCLPVVAHADALGSAGSTAMDVPSQESAGAAQVEFADVAPAASLAAPAAFQLSDSPAVGIIAPPGPITPEPSTFVLLGTGLAGLVGAVRRRRRGHAA